jgi:predicted CopG family antitoxin
MCDKMARQISVSNEIYSELSKKKGKKSFSDVIGEALAAIEDKLETEHGKAADAWLLARMKKGYKLGKIIGTRDDWHAR